MHHGPQVRRVVAVGRGVDPRLDRGQLLQLVLESLPETGDEGQPAGEEDGLSQLLPHVHAALLDGLVDENVDAGLVEAPELGLEEPFASLEALTAHLERVDWRVADLDCSDTFGAQLQLAEEESAHGS